MCCSPSTSMTALVTFLFLTNQRARNYLWHTTLGTHRLTNLIACILTFSLTCTHNCKYALLIPAFSHRLNSTFCPSMVTVGLSLAIIVYNQKLKTHNRSKSMRKVWEKLGEFFPQHKLPWAIPAISISYLPDCEEPGRLKWQSYIIKKERKECWQYFNIYIAKLILSMK